MTPMQRFWIYLKERSPLPALTFLSAGIAVSSLAIKSAFSLPLLLLGVTFNNLLFIQMRLADEVKDFENDKIINPTRPLPRGLFSIDEVMKLLKFFLTLLLATGALIALTKSPLGGCSLFLASVFSWLMYKEFYVSHQLDKSPMLYAITHQIIVFPLFAWPGLSFDQSLIIEPGFQGWLLANFGASFTFEICRKLDPKAHALAKTYAHHYGRCLTVLLCSIFMSLSAVGAYWGGFPFYSIPALLVLLVSLIVWAKQPERYKIPAGLSALSSSIILWAPAIMWLVRTWKDA